MRKFFSAVKRFFLPPAGASTLARVLPLAATALIMLVIFVVATVAWEETNATSFCGLTCHTMPPEYITHNVSSHANVSCEDCHMGRDVLGVMLPRKIIYSWQTGTAMLTGNYEYPIVAKNMRPARDACENCHKPETFTSDQLLEEKRYAEDVANTALSTFLVLKIGGGTRRQGLGYGIHWHVENPVYFYAADRERQEIPYAVVTNPDGSKTEYIDVEAGFDPDSITQDQLQQMDCITCHNRTAHGISVPTDAVDQLISRGLISADIPNIKKNATAKLAASYASKKDANAAIAALADEYRSTYPDFTAQNSNLIADAIQALQEQYTVSNFPEQKVDWQTHPNNAGHINSPGCFRCHDGQHLTRAGESVRLECNLCHSIPVVSGPDQIDALLSLNRGFEPESHMNSNWIALHRTVIDDSCQGCHSIEDAGGSSNQSFCSNAACHGAGYPFAGFDAPKLREILAEQAAALVTPTSEAPAEDPEGGVSPTIATPTPAKQAPAGPITWETVAPLFEVRCSSCHAANGMKGINLTSYQTTMTGGTDGPIVVPGNPDESELIQVQVAVQKHFGQFSAAELETVEKWILEGALEK